MFMGMLYVPSKLKKIHSLGKSKRYPVTNKDFFPHQNRVRYIFCPGILEIIYFFSLIKSFQK